MLTGFSPLSIYLSGRKQLTYPRSTSPGHQHLTLWLSTDPVDPRVGMESWRELPPRTSSDHVAFSKACLVSETEDPKPSDPEPWGEKSWTLRCLGDSKPS